MFFFSVYKNREKMKWLGCLLLAGLVKAVVPIDEWIIVNHDCFSFYSIDWTCPASTVAHWKKAYDQFRPLRWELADLFKNCDSTCTFLPKRPSWFPSKFWDAEMPSFANDTVNMTDCVLVLSLDYHRFQESTIASRVLRAIWHGDAASNLTTRDLLNGVARHAVAMAIAQYS